MFWVYVGAGVASLILVVLAALLTNPPTKMVEKLEQKLKDSE
jgi:hypothetical protein